MKQRAFLFCALFFYKISNFRFYVMGKIVLFIILYLSISNVFSQFQIKGIVIDKETRLPLAFANITANNSVITHSISDIDGKFQINSINLINTLNCTFVGFDNLTIKVEGKDYLIIEMLSTANLLVDIVLNEKDNPANKIIRKVIKNKEFNDPENLNTFKYNAYNKNVFDIIPNLSRDTISFNKVFQNGRFFITESVTSRQFIKPDLSETKILASKVSGFKNPSFAALETDNQPFSFYRDNIKLGNIYYLNPIAKGSLNKYKFRLEDEIIKNQDTIFIISFNPRKNKNFDSLSGLLYINSNKYAIQNVTAYPFEKGKINLKIQQQYKLINNEFWFPEKLNYELRIGEDKTSKYNGVAVNGKSYISDIIINSEIKSEAIDLVSGKMAIDANKKDTIFWNKYRIEALGAREIATYKVVDSIGKKYKFDNLLSFAEHFDTGVYRLKYLNIRTNKLFGYNLFEGYKFGGGLYTNQNVFGRFSIGGYANYGVTDKKWKFGFGGQYEISKKNNMLLSVEYINDLVETGNFNSNISNQSFFRKIVGFSFNKIIQNSINLKFRTSQYLNWNINFSRASVTPLFFKSIDDNKSFVNSEATLSLRYAYKEKFINTIGKTLSQGTIYPIFLFQISKGFLNLFQGEKDYEKIQLLMYQSIFTKKPWQN